MPQFTVVDYMMILSLLGLFGSQGVRCLFVTDINVPQIVDFRDNVTLSCSYDMSGHKLNSVKWYKDEMEFFRYSPLMHPVYMKFPVAGIQLTDGRNFCNESTCRVELSLLGIKSTGVYRCEVSGDAPHFKLTAKTSNMTVAALPQNNPLIGNFNTIYRFDDFIGVNCTSDYSSLPVKLTWFINGQKASYIDLQPSSETTIPVHEYTLHRRTLQLNFYANEPRYLPDGSTRVMELLCLAEIEKYPELRRQTTLNAVLRHEEDMKKQKLVNSATINLPQLLLYQFCALALLRMPIKLPSRIVSNISIWRPP